jgi:hypothetical protein
MTRANVSSAASRAAVGIREVPGTHFAEAIFPYSDKLSLRGRYATIDAEWALRISALVGHRLPRGFADKGTQEVRNTVDEQSPPQNPAS